MAARGDVGPALPEAVLAAVNEGRKGAAARLLVGAAGPAGAAALAQRLVLGAPAERVIPVALLLSRTGHHDLAGAVLTEVDHRGASLQQRRRIGRALAFAGRHAPAIAVLEELLREPEQPAYTEQMRAQDLRRLGMAQLHRSANDHLQRLEPPAADDVEGYVLVYNVANPVTTGLMVPLVGPLVERGYAVAAVSAGTLRPPVSGVPELDALQGCVTPDGTSYVGGREPELIHDWRVDWAAGVAETGGINYFPYFLERVSQRARRYRADILADPESAERFATLHLQADIALDICERLLLLAERGRPVRVALMDSHFAPQGIIREWCDAVGRHHGIHAVVLGVGYENYFSNLTSLEASTLAVEDLTAQPDLRQPFLGGPHRAQAFLDETPDADRGPDEQLLSWICQDRSRVGTGSSAHALTERARSVRAAGGKVFVALGKVSIDFAAPGDRGFVHADFVEWVNHLVEAVAGSDNLLLIKPHPHEVREEIVGDGVQLLRELVVPRLPPNVVFLEHHSFNTHELAELVDAAFLWNGTATLEFSVLGVPVVPASIWAARDYPIGFPVLRSRQEYDDVLQGRRDLDCPEDVRRRAALFLRLMRSDHVAIPYRYLRRAATNQAIGPPVLDEVGLRRLEDEPDPYVLRAASRFFEFA